MLGDTTPKQYRFGQTRKRKIPALRVAVPIGLLAALAMGVLQAEFGNPGGPYKVAAGVILGLCVAPSMICLVWVLCVDRSTLPGAVKNPEASVENAWYSGAVSDGFHVTIAACGIGAFLADYWLPSAVSWTLIAVACLAMITCGISYAVRRFR